MDAYSYLARGEVFANAQTGNLLLLGVHLASGRFDGALRYVFPILGFTLGIAVAHLIRLHARPKRLHWRQLVLGLEILLLIAVGFLPATTNLLANSLTSLACGMQVQSFRKLHGHGFATTMCIGNLRSGTEACIAWLHTKRLQEGEAALLYYGVIVCFVIGAILGNMLLAALGLHAIWVSPLLLAIACGLLIIDREALDRSSKLQ